MQPLVNKTEKDREEKKEGRGKKRRERRKEERRWEKSMEKRKIAFMEFFYWWSLGVKDHINKNYTISCTGDRLCGRLGKKGLMECGIF